jgi:hypothetical protein
MDTNCEIIRIDSDTFILNGERHQISYYKNLIDRKATGANIHMLRNNIGGLVGVIREQNMFDILCKSDKETCCKICELLEKSIKDIIKNTK